MANRLIPFGYEIVDGDIRIVKREEDVVRNVYALYIQGLTLLEIASRLNMLPISYANDGRAWDKHIVKRMLDNPKYKGDKGYPVIISEEVAKLAAECKERKGHQINEEDKKRLDAYREKISCGICGGKMIRQHAGSGTKSRMYWKCSDSLCAGHRQTFNEKRLNRYVAEFLNEMSEDISIVETNATKDYERDTTVIQAQNEMNAMLENPATEIETAIEGILNLASVKFKRCKAGDNTALTEKMKEYMAIYPKQEMPDGNIMEKVIRRILMYPNRRLKIELLNGKEFERGEVMVIQRVE